MKRILVLTPINERLTYACAGIWKSLDDRTKKMTYFAPLYAEYLKETRTKNFIFAAYESMITFNELARVSAEKKEDIVLFGNVSKKYKFDKIFSFNLGLDYDDHLLLSDEIQSVLDGDFEDLKRDNLYDAEDASMILENNLDAIAHFINKLLLADNDISLKSIYNQYKDIIHIKEGDLDGN